MASPKEATNRADSRWAGLSLVLAVLLTGCEAQSDAAVAMPPPPAVDVAEVLEEPVTLWESFTGRVESPDTVDLRPRVTGYITEVAFEEGQLVEQGELLFQIDPRPYRARAESARADLAIAESQLELARSEAGRAKSLWESRAISREEFDQRQSAFNSALARVESAQAVLDTAELDLRFTKVTAPVSGRTGRALVTRGNLANADQSLLTTLVSVDPLYVYFEANETAAASAQNLLTDGKFPAVRVSLGADSRRQYRGQLDFIDNRLNTGTGTLQYRAVLDNPGNVIRPGQFARVEMPVAEVESALLVQRKAVLADQDRRYVYVVDENNRAVPRHVTSGRQVGDLLVIEDGLAQGELVIINGVQKVFGAGMEVSPQLIAMKELNKNETAVAVMQERAQ
ncbi:MULTISPECIES: efflux RND transporter periplasmic adaptor subunit [unclassified Marinobacter]|uniref:efflux RND transporter periplasmic adaptor subunit n=1 Tax=unclassified Marinobacter TaxID=83889 RepID=UPI001928749A|nr:MULTISPECIES: efflux RND transporter periplasmic adaptor subunit [unclassified Marinobacter]MBL3827109.1 efflux RND transporter periplasmic adaptor subunit [Marinobacter sp. MC3]MBL3895666.1 efflux RND transporter periplasmic adaptor subunit [Marinobacter sp. MW3]